jgi:hypothetical protein
MLVKASYAIRPEQIGFCKNKGTSDHMFVLKTLIEKYTQNNPKVLFSCFIDLRKAFDKVRFVLLCVI